MESLQTIRGVVSRIAGLTARREIDLVCLAHDRAGLPISPLAGRLPYGRTKHYDQTHRFTSSRLASRMPLMACR